MTARLVPWQFSQPITVILLIQNTPNPAITCYLQDRQQTARQPLAAYIHAGNRLSEQSLMFIKEDISHPNQALRRNLLPSEFGLEQENN